MSIYTNSACCHHQTRHSSKQSYRNLQKRGFSLLEVLVALGATTILVLLVTNMFANVTDTSNRSIARAEMETAGRAALGFISHKLSQAITGIIEPAMPPYNWNFELREGKDVSYFSVSDTIKSERFYFDSPNIMYCCETNDPAILIDNVIDMKIYAYEKYVNLRDGNGDHLNCQLTNNLPFCVDIGIRLINSDDKKKAEQLSGADLDKFIAINTYWCTTRIYFQTRQGYINHEFNDWDKTY